MMTMVDGMMTAGSAVRLSHTVEKGTSLPFQSEMPMFLSSTKTWPRLCTFTLIPNSQLGRTGSNYMAKIELFCGWTNLRAAAQMNMC